MSVSSSPPPKRARRSLRIASATALGLVAGSATLVLAPPAQAATVDVQILATNDFHGRLINAESPFAPIAAPFAGALAQYRSTNPDNTIFAAAGDLIGASTFESFIQKDKPTLDVMNAMGLDVSAAGNHEFDQGYSDLNDRVMQPYDATTNPYGGAEWQYLAANVRKRSDDSYALRDVAASPGTSDGATWMTTTAGGAKIGFVGAVTEDLPALVSPGGIADIKVTHIVDEVETSAAALRAAGADAVVMLVHEGAATTTCATNMDTGTAWGTIVAGVEDDVDVVISGHTHLAYNCVSPVEGIPVVSAGQYGANFNALNLSVDTSAHTATVTSSTVVAASSVTVTDATAIATRDQVTSIVNSAVSTADSLGAQVLGKLAGPFYRAKLSTGSENRGGESTLGNLVAEVQRWATSDATSGGAEIAFMNPGGLRQDMLGLNTAGYPADLTYKQAAVVQPFANTLVNMDLLGSSIKKVLEQQWQRDSSNNVPSRPFLRLGTSKGFTYTFDASRPEGDRITGMWLDGTPIDEDGTYSVTVNSFLSTGGDNFRAFNDGTNKRDTGKIDLSVMVDYLNTFASNGKSVAPDFAQHAVGVTFPTPQQASYVPGDHIAFNLSSLAMTGPGDTQDSTVTVSAGGVEFGTAAVTNTPGTAVYDDYGTAVVDVVVPANAPSGARNLVVTGDQTGTKVRIPVTIVNELSETTLAASVSPASVVAGTGVATVNVTVSGGSSAATGTVVAREGSTVVGGATLAGGSGAITLAPFATAGTKTLTIDYLGDATHEASSTTASLTVTAAPAPPAKADSKVTASASPASIEVGSDTSTLAVKVTGGSAAPTGSVVVSQGSTVLGAGVLEAGAANVKVGPFDTVGDKALTVKYLGDGATNASESTATVAVTKVEPTVTVPKQKVAKGAKVSLPVAIPGATGKVTVKVKGKKKAFSAKLKNGVAVVKLGKFKKPGTYKAVVTYKGDATTDAVKQKTKIKVTKR